jgi:hypothetical protein
MTTPHAAGPKQVRFVLDLILLLRFIANAAVSAT